MTKLTKQQVNDRLNKISPVLREAVFDPDYFEAISEASQIYRLSEDQENTLTTIFGRTLMGFIPLTSFQNEVRTTLNIDTETASRIANLLNKKIFTPLKPELDKLKSQFPTRDIPKKNIINLKTSPPPVKQPIPSPPRQPALPPKPIEQVTPRPLTPPSPSFAPPPISQNFFRSDKPTTPLILHEESEVRPVSPPPNLTITAPEVSSSRSDEKIKERPVRARVEIGRSYRAVKKEAAITPTKTKPVKQPIVNYGSVTPQNNDPFSILKKSTPPPASPPKISGNTIDLSK